MITQANYLDVGNLLINELFGSVALFIVVGIAILTYLGVKFTLPFQVTLFVIFLFVGLITSYVFNSLLWMLALFVVGVAIYSFMPKLFRRQ